MPKTDCHFLKKKVAERCKKREQRKFTFFAEPKQCHEVKWQSITITITIGMRTLSFSEG